ncbi:Transcriptional regulatory protein QseB [compost metagenome]
MSAVLRRAPTTSLSVLSAGNVTYDRVSCDVYVNGFRVSLTRRELLIMETLLRNRGRTVLRSSLEGQVYSFDDEIQSNSLESNMSRLRRKLSEAEADIVIKNIRGIGYYLHEQK